MDHIRTNGIWIALAVIITIIFSLGFLAGFLLGKSNCPEVKQPAAQELPIKRQY